MSTFVCKSCLGFDPDSCLVCHPPAPSGVAEDITPPQPFKTLVAEWRGLARDLNASGSHSAAIAWDAAADSLLAAWAATGERADTGPDEAAVDRAAEAICDATTGEVPWATLKAMAARPGSTAAYTQDLYRAKARAALAAAGGSGERTPGASAAWLRETATLDAISMRERLRSMADAAGERTTDHAERWQWSNPDGAWIVAVDEHGDVTIGENDQHVTTISCDVRLDREAVRRTILSALAGERTTERQWWVMHDPHDGDSGPYTEEQAVAEARRAMATYAAEGIDVHGLSVRLVAWQAEGGPVDGWDLVRLAGERTTEPAPTPLARFKNGDVVTWTEDDDEGRWTVNGQVGIWSADGETCEFAYPDDLRLVGVPVPDPTEKP